MWAAFFCPLNSGTLVPAISDRRVWLFLLSTALALALGFFAIPDSKALSFVSALGYWFVLAAFLLFIRALWREFRPEVTAMRVRRLDWASIAVIAIGGVVLLVHETFGFKIVMDEIMLLGTSMSMHFNRAVLTPTRGNDIQGAFVIIEGIMDKRPIFFPFLVSILHDLTGYRPENAFILNGCLVFVFLGLVYLAGRLFAGRLAGWLGVALFAGLPLLAQNATGGGFELLNLVMILSTLLLGARFLGKRDGLSFTAFCYSALLLVQVRYESAVFLVPVVAIILWVWFREGRAILTWPVIFAPLLMIHCPLQHRIFDIRASAWQMESKPGFTKPFSLSYIPDNLAHAVSYFFGKATDQPNSLVLSTLGCIAIPFLAVLVVRRLQALRSEPPVSVAMIFFTFGFAAQFALMMCYFWGQFDDAIIRRLSLPTQLWMVLAVLAVVPQFPRPAVLKGLIALALIGLLARGVPSMAAHAYNQEYLAGLETAWRRKFIAEQPRKDYMMIDNDSILWVSHEVSSTPVFMAIRNRAAIVFYMRNHAFSNVYVFQRYNIDADTGRMTLRDGDDLGPDFVLEPVREERLLLLTQTRISRVKEVRSGPEVLTRPDPVEHEVPKDHAAIERMRQAYLENFLKQLP